METGACVFLGALMMLLAAGSVVDAGVRGKLAMLDGERSALHCLSLADGSHVRGVGRVKARLAAPESFQHIETRMTAADDNGSHVMLIDFLSRDAAGATVRRHAAGAFRGEDCAIIDLMITEPRRITAPAIPRPRPPRS